MKVVIVEDEQLVAEELIKMLQEVADDIEIIAYLDSVENSVKWFSANDNTAELIFFDVNLGDGNSFTIFEQVRINCPVIFVTAYDEYAIQAFKYNSIDFLLKPITKQDLENALGQINLMRNVFEDKEEATAPYQKQRLKSYKKRFLSSSLDNKMIPISVKDIAYFRAEGKQLYIINRKGESFLLNSTLKEVETTLDPTQFYRINRKIIVNFDAVKEVISFSKNRKKVMLMAAPKHPLETIVSHERTKEFLNWLG